MAWNMPQFLEIHIIKRYSHTALEVCAEQPCGCPGSILAAIITQHCVPNKCQAFFISAQWNSFCPIQMQMQAPMTEMIKDVMLPVA